MKAGEALCLFTDGVTEAMNSTGELFGRPRLEALLAGLGRGASAAEIGEAIRREVGTFAAGVDPADDVAIVVLRWHGPARGGDGAAVSER
jgi:serine phosphatase RsbU (regulator of sigma subunit)